MRQVLAGVRATSVPLIVLVATNVWNPFPRVWGIGRPQPAAGEVRRGVAAARRRHAEDSDRRRGDGHRRGAAGGRGAQLADRRPAVAAQGGLGGGRRDTGDAAVVAIGELLVKGYEVLDPETGAVRRAGQPGGRCLDVPGRPARRALRRAAGLPAERLGAARRAANVDCLHSWGRLRAARRQSRSARQPARHQSARVRARERARAAATRARLPDRRAGLCGRHRPGPGRPRTATGPA